MFENITPEVIKQRIFDAMKTDMDTREGSYTDALVSPAALEIWKIYMSLNGLIPIVYPNETSGEYIDKKCAYYGIERKPGLKASVTLTVTGKNDTAVPKGAVFLSPENLRFLTDEDAVIQNGAALIPAFAAEPGTKYNVSAGHITKSLSSISGIATVTNEEAAVGGTDAETDASLIKRLYTRLQNAATSGNANHYKQWAMEVNGVGATKIKPLADGPGTVTVLIASSDMEPVDSATVAACAKHIEELCPIGAAVTVRTVSGLAINVAATVSIDSGTTIAEVQNAFEADLTGYLRSISFEQYIVPYTKIGYLLAGIDGVLDYSNLTINGSATNITVAEEQVPQAGTVVFV